MARKFIGSSAQVRAGEVFRIRLSPRDIVGCVRVVEATNTDLSQVGLARVVGFAIRVLLASARKTQLIPDVEDPFNEYQRVKLKYSVPQEVALQNFVHLETQDLKREVADMPHLADDAASRLSTGGLSPQQQRWHRRLSELISICEMDALNHPTEEERTEMEDLTNKLRGS